MAKRLSSKQLRSLKCGKSHAVAISSSGHCYFWTSAGSEAFTPWSVPMPVELGAARIVDIGCGTGHTVAVFEDGQVVTFGRSDSGQCGHGSFENERVPRVVSALYSRTVKRVACGPAFTILLTNTGDLYGFGENESGQLGIGVTTNTAQPVRMHIADTVPVAGVACGDAHTVVWDVDGRVYATGDNRFGQLGLGSELIDRLVTTPMMVNTLSGRHVVHAAGGGSFTVFLTSSGRVFTCGTGSNGRLGLGNVFDVYVPTEVVGCLLGERIGYVAAGRKFAVALTVGGTLYGWGQDGALGDKAKGDQLNPVMVTSFPGAVIRAVEASRDSVLVLATHLGKKSNGKAQTSKRTRSGSVAAEPTTPIARTPPLAHLDMESFSRLLDEGRGMHGDYCSLIRRIEVVFSSGACLNASFLRGGSSRPKSRRHTPHIDFIGLRKFYDITQNILPAIGQRLNAAVMQTLTTLGSPPDNAPYGTLRAYHILLLALGPAANDMATWRNAVHAVAAAFMEVHPRLQEVHMSWLAQYPAYCLKKIASVCRQYVDSYIASGWTQFEAFSTVVHFMQAVYEANAAGGGRVAIQDFYSDAVNTSVNLLRDYDLWKGDIIRSASASPHDFSFCAFPFLIDAKNKTAILQHEAAMQRYHEYGQAVLANVFSVRQQKPNLQLRVRRRHLIEDTIDQLIAKNRQYRKPLKVTFIDEPGQDEGGLRKEFFQLITREVFDVEYGMFCVEEETNNYFFDRQSLASPGEFQLIGTILGLAIYNAVILSVNFPSVVYKKLVGDRLTLDDFIAAFPTTGRSLQMLLDYDDDGDIEATFGLTFAVTDNYYGEIRTHELVPGGPDVPVTKNNRHEYVERYIQFVMQDSVADQFNAFRTGFYQVCGTPAFKLLNAEELELAICGQPVLDFDEMEAHTRYIGGYSRDDAIIDMFWEVVKAFTNEQKAALLKFTTGTDRIPVGGFELVEFTIEKARGDKASPERLPSSHTCFNVLVLPCYPTVAVMRTRLRTAILHDEGFGEV